MDIFTLITFIGGLGLFLFGMSVLSEAIGRQAGGRMKDALEKITSNRLTGIALGAGVTAVIQSSGATTVMLMGFINSGILSLQNAVGPILGANIGTTATAWLLALNDISGALASASAGTSGSGFPYATLQRALWLKECLATRMQGDSSYAPFPVDQTSGGPGAVGDQTRRVSSSTMKKSGFSSLSVRQVRAM